MLVSGSKSHEKMSKQSFVDPRPGHFSFVAGVKAGSRNKTGASTPSITLSKSLSLCSPEGRLAQHPGLGWVDLGRRRRRRSLAGVDGPLAPAEGLPLAPSQRAGAAHARAGLKRHSGISDSFIHICVDERIRIMHNQYGN